VFAVRGKISVLVYVTSHLCPLKIASDRVFFCVTAGGIYGNQCELKCFLGM